MADRTTHRRRTDQIRLGLRYLVNTVSFPPSLPPFLPPSLSLRTSPTPRDSNPPSVHLQGTSVPSPPTQTSEERQKKMKEGKESQKKREKEEEDQVKRILLKRKGVSVVRPIDGLKFHADNLSSAHIYLRLTPEQQWDALPKELVEECAQLTKANSIEGSFSFSFRFVSFRFSPSTHTHTHSSPSPPLPRASLPIFHSSRIIIWGEERTKGRKVVAGEGWEKGDDRGEEEGKA